MTFKYMQKQPPEKFVKKFFVKVLQYSQETPMLESLFNSKYCEIFYSTYFEEHLPTAAFFHEKNDKMFMKLRKIKNC